MWSRVLALGWVVLVCFQLADVSRRTQEAVKTDVSFLTPPFLATLDDRILNVALLGWRPLFDDYAAIWSVQLLMDKRVYDVDPKQLGASLSLVTRHHPRIPSIYALGCFVLALDLSSPELCERLTIDGMAALPNEWRVPVIEAYIEGAKMGNAKGAATYYSIAASKPGCPNYIKDLARKLIERNNLSADELQSTLDAALDGRSSVNIREVMKFHK